jgi:hypothetical protein
VTNLTGERVKLVDITGDAPLDHPPIGTVLQPGESADFELTRYFAKVV